MSKSTLIVLAAVLVAAPLAVAHYPIGTPKNYCETFGEWDTHDYGPVASGRIIYGSEDGNLDDCDGGGNDVVVVVNGPCPPGYEEFLHIPGPPVDIRICIKRTADYDGHAEYALGGAVILVESGYGEPSWDPNVGAGTLYCYGDEGHHAVFGPVSVLDMTTGYGASYIVGIDDTINTIPTNLHVVLPGHALGFDGCGDGIIDRWQQCSGTCTVPFGPGLDGAYYVFVDGTQGHVEW